MDWVYFKDKMPEEHDSMFTKYYGTDKWKHGMFRTVRHNLLFTIEHKKQRIVVDGRMVDGKPMCEYARMYPDTKYIAWMPYPEPVKEGGLIE